MWILDVQDIDRGGVGAGGGGGMKDAQRVPGEAYRVGLRGDR